jgi:SAM-dependent methyltransferase
MARLSYHEALGVLGIGDLHPGGAEASSFLLDEVAKEHPRLVLEVGAGIGRTTSRMRSRGWEVVSLEPNVVLRQRFAAEHPGGAQAESLEAFAGAPGTFDAVIAESVLYGMSLSAVFATLHRLLRPNGLVAMVDLVWTSEADPAVAARIHDETSATYGIPMASRERLTWTDWQMTLQNAGFVPVVERRLKRGARAVERIGLAAVARHPVAVATLLRYRFLTRRVAVPPGWLESWMSVWRRVS